MRVHYSSHFDVSARIVALIIADEDFIEHGRHIPHATVTQAHVSGDADSGFTVTARLFIPAADLPSTARGFLPSGLDIHEVSVWGQPDMISVGDHDEPLWKGNFTIDVSGAPIRATGGVGIIPDAHGGCDLTYDGDVKAMIPLIGASMEKTAHPYVEHTFIAQDAAIRARLGQ